MPTAQTLLMFATAALALAVIPGPTMLLALSNGIRSALIGWSKTLAAEVATDGVTVNVPEFVEEGTRVRVNPTTGEYLERAKD